MSGRESNAPSGSARTTCPQCNDPVIQPRNGEDYCENCGWPEENRPEVGVESGLRPATLRKYAKSALLERLDGRAHYMHSARCPNYCDYACKGNHGWCIANDIATLEAKPNKGMTGGEVVPSNGVVGDRP